MTTRPGEPEPMAIQATGSDELAPEGLDPIQRDAYEWIVRFMRGGMSSAEIESMRAWYRQSPAHAKAYADVRRVWNALGPVARASMRDNPDAASKVYSEKSARPVVSARLGRRALIGGALAASAAYALAKPPLDLWPSYSEMMADYRTGAGERRILTLADTVTLDLNTRTSVTVLSQTAEMIQLELLAGEAAFSKSDPSSALTVVAGSARMVAMRTNFNLRCDGSRVSVACLDGDLLVQRGSAKAQLRPREEVIYDDRAISDVRGFDPDRVSAWQQGKLIFDGTPVAQVIAEINRYRPNRIILMNDQIGRRLLTARVATAETDKIVVQIVHIFGANARTLPGGIVVLT